MSKDLFDESTMTFGEHLEVLRVHLWRAVIGLLIATVISFFISKNVLLIIQAPVTAAMQRYFGTEAADKHLLEEPTAWEMVRGWFGGGNQSSVAVTTTEASPDPKPPQVGTDTAASVPVPISKDPPNPALERPAEAPAPTSTRNTLVLDVDVMEIARALHKADKKAYPPVPDNAPPVIVPLKLTRESQIQLETLINAQNAQIRTDSVDEAFMIYLKVSIVCGVVIASPYIFYEIWLFVAAGLYPHERKYVYTYLPLSLGLFLGGAALCFFGVIPLVLDFLFGFNKWLDLRPEMKISSWLSFVLMLPLMFGISFQLPLVMLFLEKINVFTVQVYRGYRRHAILVISILSMILTPSDPVSMLFMMIPLLVLYELGILLCGRTAVSKSPFQTQPA